MTFLSCCFFHLLGNIVDHCLHEMHAATCRHCQHSSIAHNEEFIEYMYHIQWLDIHMKFPFNYPIKTKFVGCCPSVLFSTSFLFVNKQHTVLLICVAFSSEGFCIFSPLFREKMLSFFTIGLLFFSLKNRDLLLLHSRFRQHFLGSQENFLRND